MKKHILIVVMIVSTISCNKKEKLSSNVDTVSKDLQSKIIGTWKLLYGETKTNDSIEVKDLSNTAFIKILNNNHFAFFNQKNGTSEGFYGGGGSYSLEGSVYTETLNYLSVEEIRGHEFVFNVEFKGDTLIQSGIEDVPDAGIKRFILEKYIRIK